MAVRRFFLVTQDELIVWQASRGRLVETVRFTSTDEGLSAFSAYARRTAEQPATMVVDVIEEEFVADTAPKLSLRDRNALIERRLARKFSRTPYRIGIHQGRAEKGGTEQEILLCSVSNHELLDPWLQTIERHKVPLNGIYSVPLLAASLLSRITATAANALLLTQHQGTRLRQAFLKNGRLKSARLSQSPAIGDADYGEFILTEIQRSRRYLERSRLLSALDGLDVYLIADEGVAARVLKSNRGDAAMQLHIVEPGRAAMRLGVAEGVVADHLESLYLAAVSNRRPTHNYAVQGESRYSFMLQARHALIGLAAACAMVSATVASFNFVDAQYLRNASEAIDLQNRQLAETFRRDNESFQPVRADSHEMKIAVDTGDFILQNRLPVPWVMYQLGLVLGGFPQVQVDVLQWQAEPVAGGSGPPARSRPGEAPPPAPIPRLAEVSADLQGEIADFDGDLRGAFALIDEFASTLQSRTAFDSVVTVEYPVDARPQSALAGEVARSAQDLSARFRLRLSMKVVQEENRRDSW
jgi:hypothetical protein